METNAFWTGSAARIGHVASNGCSTPPNVYTAGPTQAAPCSQNGPA
jgi:hypothetical protein